MLSDVSKTEVENVVDLNEVSAAEDKAESIVKSDEFYMEEYLNRMKTANRSAVSRVLNWEELKARDVLLDKYRKTNPEFILPSPTGRRIVVALHVRDEHLTTFTNDQGQTINFVLPPSVRDNDKYMTCTGCVLSVGPEAYSDTKWYTSGPLCKVGDYIAFPRHAGSQWNYMGIPVHNIPEDGVHEVLVDPDDVKLY